MNASVLEARGPVSFPGRICSTEESLSLISWPLVDLLMTSQFFSKKCTSRRSPSSLGNSDSVSSWLPLHHQKNFVLLSIKKKKKNKKTSSLPHHSAESRFPWLLPRSTCTTSTAFPLLLQLHTPGSSDEFCHLVFHVGFWGLINRKAIKNDIKGRRNSSQNSTIMGQVVCGLHGKGRQINLWSSEGRYKPKRYQGKAEKNLHFYFICLGMYKASLGAAL